MKSKTFMHLITITCLLTTGCLPSLHPLFTENDLIFDPELVGIWEEPEDEMVWIFSTSIEEAYDLTIVDDGEKSEFEANLLVLTGQTYLDLYPRDLELESGFYESHFIKAHTFYRIDIQENRFEISIIDGNWLKKESKHGRLDLQTIELEHDTTLTISPTKVLQEFVVSHSDTQGFWENPSILIRRR